jgi:UDP-N-acetylmuramyl pentapeptide phosphotransferase/UDP-N-acetylglucosamine-1-phosphate transferase
MESFGSLAGSQILHLVLSFVSAMIITAICIPQIIRLSKKYKLVDNPNQRKMHKVPIPTLGGVGFFTGFIVLSLFWMIVLGNLSDFVLFIALVALFVTGIFDDLTDMRALIKFGIQIIVALTISYFGFRVESLFGIFGIYEMPVIAQYAFSVLLITGLTNAFNLIDGIDGLAGGLAFINSMIMGLILLMQGNVIYAILAISFAGALFGFLIFNFNPAKIFMGDTGSLIVGFLMAIFGIVILKTGVPANFLFENYSSGITIVVVGILLLPVYDTLRVFAERILKKSSPFKPDKTHVHHLLIETGANHKKAVFILYTTNILIIAAAFLLHKSNPSFSVLMLFILAAVLSESINIKRWFMEIAQGKKAMEETSKITSENRFLEDILDENDKNL